MISVKCILSCLHMHNINETKRNVMLDMKTITLRMENMCVWQAALTLKFLSNAKPAILYFMLPSLTQFQYLYETQLKIYMLKGRASKNRTRKKFMVLVYIHVIVVWDIHKYAQFMRKAFSIRFWLERLFESWTKINRDCHMLTMEVLWSTAIILWNVPMLSTVDGQPNKQTNEIHFITKRK